jgi:predicted ATP-grasp superfamily ATP-dependent carboligase
MSSQADVLLIGASVRGAALSALRAGLHPWCADLFADADLGKHCPALRLPGADYPQGFLPLVEQAANSPWMYTGGLENHPKLVGHLARLRPLWGNGRAVLERVRSPGQVAATLAAHDIPHPRLLTADQAPTDGHWLLKPLRSAGGAGIRLWSANTNLPARPKRYYLQQFLDGVPCGAVYLGRREGAQLLGVTRQLAGTDWLHAGPFHYCGSIGPLDLSARLHQAFVRIGEVLSATFALRGLFGVDCILKEEVLCPIEVNPRYTASVEVLELATGRSLVALHRAVFDVDHQPKVAPLLRRQGNGMVGKAIVFAPTEVVIPEVAPWQACIEEVDGHWDVPAFADIPRAGIRVETGQPLVTLLCRGDSEEHCWQELRERAAALTEFLQR